MIDCGNTIQMTLITTTVLQTRQKNKEIRKRKKESIITLPRNQERKKIYEKEG